MCIKIYCHSKFTMENKCLLVTHVVARFRAKIKPNLRKMNPSRNPRIQCCTAY